MGFLDSLKEKTKAIQDKAADFSTNNETLG